MTGSLPPSSSSTKPLARPRTKIGAALTHLKHVSICKRASKPVSLGDIAGLAVDNTGAPGGIWGSSLSLRSAVTKVEGALVPLSVCPPTGLPQRKRTRNGELRRCYTCKTCGQVKKLGCYCGLKASVMLRAQAHEWDRQDAAAAIADRSVPVLHDEPVQASKRPKLDAEGVARAGKKQPVERSAGEQHIEAGEGVLEELRDSDKQRDLEEKRLAEEQRLAHEDFQGSLDKFWEDMTLREQEQFELFDTASDSHPVVLWEGPESPFFPVSEQVLSPWSVGSGLSATGPTDCSLDPFDLAPIPTTYSTLFPIDLEPRQLADFDSLFD